jgi:signal transduction histidine kinase
LVVDDATIGRRFDAQVEAAAYFCVAEALRDLGDPIVVRLTTSEDLLNMTVTGGDRGGVPLGHMRDRVEAAGGSVAMTDKDGCTVITVQLPEAARERVPT